MAAHEGHALRLARGAELREERGDLRLGGTPLGKQTRGQEPARNRAAHGQVVGVDHHGVPAQILRHERDRIRRGHQIAVAHVEHGRVLTDPGSDDDPRIRHRVPGQELAEQGRAELAERERGGHSSRASIASLVRVHLTGRRGHFLSRDVRPVDRPQGVREPNGP